MKLVNPLYYPLAVLAGGITLVMGIRLIQVSNLVAIPTAIAVATGISIPLSIKEGNRINLNNPVLEREIRTVKQQASLLVNQAEELKKEATSLLTDSSQLELLATVEYTCDCINDTPQKIEQLSRKLQGSDSLLSPAQLEQQISSAKKKRRQSSGVAQQQLQQLITSLENNLNLAKEGEDARQAQVIALNTLVIDSAGVLQQLQNRLRTANLSNSTQLDQLKELSNELKNMQENLDVLIS